MVDNTSKEVSDISPSPEEMPSNNKEAKQVKMAPKKVEAPKPLMTFEINEFLKTKLMVNVQNIQKIQSQANQAIINENKQMQSLIDGFSSSQDGVDMEEHTIRLVPNQDGNGWKFIGVYNTEELKEAANKLQ